MREFIESDEQLRGGQPFILIGHSQGTLVSRALLEGWDDHPVRMFVSLAGPHLGQYGLFADLVSNPFLRGLATSAAWTVLYNEVKRTRHSNHNCPRHFSRDWFFSSSWPRKTFVHQTFGVILITTRSS